jgi:hypothetical protein
MAGRNMSVIKPDEYGLQGTNGFDLESHVDVTGSRRFL